MIRQDRLVSRLKMEVRMTLLNVDTHQYASDQLH